MAISLPFSVSIFYWFIFRPIHIYRSIYLSYYLFYAILLSYIYLSIFFYIYIYLSKKTNYMVATFRVDLSWSHVVLCRSLLTSWGTVHSSLCKMSRSVTIIWAWIPRPSKLWSVCNHTSIQCYSLVCISTHIHPSKPGLEMNTHYANNSILGLCLMWT